MGFGLLTADALADPSTRAILCPVFCVICLDSQGWIQEFEIGGGGGGGGVLRATLLGFRGVFRSNFG